MTTTVIPDTEPQVAAGKVLWHFTMSLDGFVAGPNHTMDWMEGITNARPIAEEYMSTTGAILGGRDGFEAFPNADSTYDGDWQAPVFILTHHPEDAPPTPNTTFLNCGVAEAIRIGLEAASGKNLEILSASIGRQALELGLIDDIDLHIAPVLLGNGIRLFDNPGGTPIKLQLLNGNNPTTEINVRYRPVPAGQDR
ncbi:dihydrofolate reductase family protein [Kribbella albertanoniae]|uniref:Dihydrofolate reductase n=1 Tax=Kribbella albertanoniae TaxID=1266829 RepID=A0A4R4PHS3_9ACTN|nr:dihydrofolate reductase family protein [Kribbella albertanoniae]TDC21393.1 dihydrofolate reductase [Kribbella albertanoniae]